MHVRKGVWFGVNVNADVDALLVNVRRWQLLHTTYQLSSIIFGFERGEMKEEGEEWGGGEEKEKEKEGSGRTILTVLDLGRLK